MRRALLVALGTLLVAPAAAASSPGVTLVSRRQLDPRLSELTFHTPALPADTRVRVLLPRNYDRTKRRYPVLYLLHGAAGNQADWTTLGDAEAITAGRPLIVVMPDGGPLGWYTNWIAGAGTPQWETWHIDQLIPWVDAHLRTRADRSHRAIAGLSMGGFGAFSYAARHPDLFAAAASFSGAVNIDSAFGPVVVPKTAWGPRAADPVRWFGHDPTDLAGNLRPLRLWVRTGNGHVGAITDPIEVAVHAMGLTIHHRLDALHIAHTWDDYGPGTHTWPYWQRDLRQTLPGLMKVFRHPAGRPKRISFTAVEPRFRVFGWQVRRSDPALEATTLSRAGRHGFALRGSGAARVRTPRFYRPHARLRIVVRDGHGHTRTSRRADRTGRLRVDLLPAPHGAARVKVRAAGG